MDPQSQSFTPFNNLQSNSETWRLQNEVARIQQLQIEHAERIARLERRHDDDARMKSVWGNSSPFPSVLSGGTPQQAPIQHPPNEAFREFDDDAVNLISSLHLDAEEEPRRGMGASSRANSVRFDESANQNHFSHSSRPSMDALSRTSSGLGGLRMDERSSSHKSEGRASSAHSIRSTASGRVSSLNLDLGYITGDSVRSPLENPGFAPGLIILGSVPAIIRCWMSTNFKHDALLYAAICTGSYNSFLDMRLVRKFGFEEDIMINEDGSRTLELPVYLPEAVHHPASSRSSSPAPQLPSLRVGFQVVDNARSTTPENKAIQIFLGSDVLRTHNADILFSSNSMTLFDSERNKLSIPLVRPENEEAFKGLHITSNPNQARSRLEPEASQSADPTFLLNGLGGASSRASISPTTASPPPGKYVASRVAASENGGNKTGSDSDGRPTSPFSNASHPALSRLNTRTDVQESSTDAAGETQTSASRTGANNWRRDAGPPSTSPQSTATTTSATLDWANAGKPRDTSYQRRDTGIKVLKPKIASRAASATIASPSSTAPWATAPAAAAPTPAGDGKSRFFDDGKQRNAAPDAKKDASGAPPKTKSNPIGGASAFSWLNSGGQKTAP
ncbi:Hypothetical protein R9X50_00589800 [Acrodontium crateriforme]|uniref:Ubiquitin carboxyl-terminal hydrolase 19 n=1 Tax=Acrodontium crateriforme TaxID=150365 RepID=A0AAQ3M7Y0_9PEZI|nr:Hypothetical protein R9X50_00589800 [Acrodontium crateriforme]